MDARVLDGFWQRARERVLAQKTQPGQILEIAVAEEVVAELKATGRHPTDEVRAWRNLVKRMLDERLVVLSADRSHLEDGSDGWREMDLSPEEDRMLRSLHDDGAR